MSDTITQKKRGRPASDRRYSGPCIALRLPPPHMDETLRLAEQEASTPANFVRRIYLIGLSHYQQQLAATPQQDQSRPN